MQTNPHATCATILDNLCSSGLTYKLNETPFSVYLTIRKKFTKDHAPTHTNPETKLKNLESKVNNLKADLDYKSKVNSAEKESLVEKLKDADQEIKTSRILIKGLQEEVPKYEAKLADLALTETELENAINRKNNIGSTLQLMLSVFN